MQTINDQVPPTTTEPDTTVVSEPYPDAASTQNANLFTRLRARRFTSRRLFVFAAALGLLALAQPWAPTFAVGCMVVVSGLALRIWTFGHLRKNQDLVTSGPYAYTRNPAYLGSALVMIGLFLASGNPWTSVGMGIWCAGLVAVYVFFTRYMPRKYQREYGRLRALFGDAVDRHADNVPDFFPRLTPWRDADTQRFQWACVRANHELVWPVVSTLALVTIWLG